MSMKRRYVLVLALLAPCLAQAELHAQFKKFAIGKEGMWNATTVVVAGPQKGQTTSTSTCVKGKESAAAAQNMMVASSAVPNCKTTVTKDTATEATSEQNCAMAGINTSISTQMKKLDDNSFETTMTTKNAGVVVSQIKTTSSYTGPCTGAAAAPAAPAVSSPELAKQCAECKANAAEMKAKCKAASAQEQAMCNAIIPQMEAGCAMACK